MTEEEVPQTPWTPGTPYPLANTQAVNELSVVMRSYLNSLGNAFDSLGEQTTKLAALEPALHTANQIRHLRRQMRNQEKHQDARINDIKALVRDNLKVQIAEHLREQIAGQIKDEIANQVKDEVSHQIETHLPIPLAIQATESHEQLAEVRVSLQNNEARLYNSHLERSKFQEPLAPLLRADGTPSEKYPATIKALFSYEPDVIKELLQEYGLPLHTIRESNVNRFLSFVGVRFQLIPPPAK